MDLEAVYATELKRGDEIYPCDWYGPTAKPETVRRKYLSPDRKAVCVETYQGGDYEFAIDALVDKIMV